MRADPGAYAIAIYERLSNVYVRDFVANSRNMCSMRGLYFIFNKMEKKNVCTNGCGIFIGFLYRSTLFSVLREHA